MLQWLHCFNNVIICSILVVHTLCIFSSFTCTSFIIVKIALCTCFCTIYFVVVIVYCVCLFVGDSALGG